MRRKEAYEKGERVRGRIVGGGFTVENGTSVGWARETLEAIADGDETENGTSVGGTVLDLNPCRAGIIAFDGQHPGRSNEAVLLAYPGLL